MIKLLSILISLFMFLAASCDDVEELSKRSSDGEDDKSSEADESGASFSEEDQLFLSDIFEFFDEASEAGNSSMLDLAAKYSDGSEIEAVTEALKKFDSEKIAELVKKIMSFADKDGSKDIDLEEFIAMKFKAKGEMPAELKEFRTELFKEFSGDADAIDVDALTKLITDRKVMVKRVKVIRKLADKFKGDATPFRDRVCLVLKKDFGERLGGLFERIRERWAEKCKDVEDKDKDEDVAFNKLPADLASCETVDDCVLVDTLCFKKAINKSHKDEYEAWMKEHSPPSEMIMCPAIFWSGEPEVKCEARVWRPSGGKKCGLKHPLP